MPRRSLRDVTLSKQRAMFGVDRLERQVADLTVELLRLVREGEVRDVSRETAHVKRLCSWLELYSELQRSDFELGGGKYDVEVGRVPEEK